MIGRALGLAVVLSSPAVAESPLNAKGGAVLSAVTCPFSGSDVPAGYQVACSRMAWQDHGIDFRTSVAVFTPEEASTDALPVIYIPGGPGDAPVTAEPNLDNVLSLFPGHALITLNPRGVKGAEPRPKCVFDDDFWHEELSSQRETEIAVGCRDQIDLDLTVFDAPYLAQDISRMVNALGINSAGVFGVSYGTESILHLLSAPPKWLQLAIMDSVSLPGALDIRGRLAARDRFLGVIDRLCFEEKQCPESVTDEYNNLIEWAAQFDDAPIEITLGPDGAPWSLDGEEVIDFLASMTSYPDGAGYGPVFIDSLTWSRESTAPWIATELSASFEYALENFALLFGAFSDSTERTLPTPKRGSTRYPFNVDDQRESMRLFKVWNRSGRNEARFAGREAKPSAPGIPVLVLSGGVDSLTPVEWADDLERRFSGMTRFVFPELGHAVAFGTDADVTDSHIVKQLNCGPDVVRAFVSNKDYGTCARYMRKATDD